MSSLILALWGMLALHATAPSLPAGAPDTALWTELDSLVDTAFTKGGQFSACALRVRDGALLWGRLPQARQMPASTEKIFTTEAALRVLGPDFRFVTSLYGRGAQRGKDWIGDLVLVGGGDPTLGSEWGATLTPLATALGKLGIRHVTGRLIALDTLAGPAPWGIWPPDWTFGNARDAYGAPIAGLNWNLNRDGWKPTQEPRELALKALRQFLSRHGVTVAGSDTILVRGDSGAALGHKWALLGQVRSPSLGVTLRPFLAESINQVGEALVLRMGAGFNKPREEPREAGMRRLRSNLVAVGVRMAVLDIHDGSGLSRYDAVTTGEMAALLRRSWLAAGTSRTVDYLAAGGQGTLRKRFRRLPDPSWVIAKTGTLSRVSNLAGILRVPGRDTVAFAIFCQNYLSGAASMRVLQDKIVSLLAGVPIRASIPEEEEDDDSLPARPREPIWPRLESETGISPFSAWRWDPVFP